MVWIRILVSAALLLLLGLIVDVRAIRDLLKEVDAAYLPLLIVVNTSAYLLFALRWRYFRNKLGLPGSIKDSLRGIYLFQVTSQIVPSPLLSETARFAVFPKSTSKATILKSIALDRLANQWSLVGWVTLLLPYYWYQNYPDWFKGLLVIPMLAVIASFTLGRYLARSRGESPWVKRLSFLKHLVGDRHGIYPFSLGLFLSVVLGVDFYLAGRALGFGNSITLELILLVPLLSMVISLLPISFADWGTREVAALLVLQPTGLSAENIVAISILVGAVNLICGLPGVLLLPGTRRLAR